MNDLSKIKLWFFRELTSKQRLALFSIFGMPVDEIGDMSGHQTIAFRHIFKALDLTSEGEAADTLSNATEAQPAQPDLEVMAYFTKDRWGGYWQTVRGGHPYNFRETLSHTKALTDAQAHIAALTAETKQQAKWLDERGVVERSLRARVETAEARVAQLEEAARVFEDHYERSICHHEETHRGGSIWTICNQCGGKWADDEGGFKPFEYPSDIIEARAALHPEKEGEQ